MAGTAYGDVRTDDASLSDPPPPGGTIFDRMSTLRGQLAQLLHRPAADKAIIPSIIEKYPTNLAPIAEFYVDCLPRGLCRGELCRSRVRRGFGTSARPWRRCPSLAGISAGLQTVGGDEEDPQDMYYGEEWAYTVLQAVLCSPAWPRTLLIYTYDEHGGYYDHVPPPAAIPPDSIPPDLTAGDVPALQHLRSARAGGGGFPVLRNQTRSPT